MLVSIRLQYLHQTVSAFFQDMRRHGLSDPLVVVSDGAAAIIKAIETCFPRWPEVKARVTAAYQAPSRAITAMPSGGGVHSIIITPPHRYIVSPPFVR